MVMKYAEYLKSEHWQEKRKAALDRSGNKCQICSSTKRLEVHHNTYENVWDEKDTDLVVLCHDCHTLFSLNSRLISQVDILPRSYGATIFSDKNISVVNDFANKYLKIKRAGDKALRENDGPKLIELTKELGILDAEFSLFLNGGK